MAGDLDALETVLEPLKQESGAAPGQLYEGASLGRYIVLGLLGKGGMGEVYRGYDPKLRREVAIKLLQSEPDGGAIARLVREAQAMAQLSHPNVVPVYDVEEHHGRVFLAMELVVGQTLRSWIAEGHTSEETLAVFIQAGRGLAAAHAVELIHRDFKPGNVMVGEDGRARVMDFGVARGTADHDAPVDATSGDDKRELERSHDSLSAPLTRAGMVLGTPVYMAPERHRGEAVDHRGDQYAFCVALYEALAGARPFGRPRSSDLLRAKVEMKPATIESVRRHVQRALSKGLSPEPEDRFDSMDALLAELERNPGSSTRRIGVVVAVAAVAGGGYGWSRWSEFQRAAACTEEGRAIASVWDEGAKPALEAALATSGKAYAATTYASTARLLDEAAAHWAEATATACRRAKVDGNWGAETLARARWCLDVRRGEIAALVERLREAESLDVETAVERAAGLASVQPCLDERALAGIEVPPAEKREALRGTTDTLARANALVDSKKLDEGVALAEEALALAEELGARTIAARASIAVANALDAQGKFAEGAASRKAAYFTAMEAGAPHVAGAAATGLIYSNGVHLAHESEARDWHRHAQIALRAAGLDDDGLSQAAATLNLGTTEFNAENVGVAADLFEQALAVFEGRLGTSHPQVASVLNMLGSAAARSEDFAKARSLFERAVAIQRATYGDEHPAVATTLHNLATALHVQGNYAAAEKLYEESLAIRERSLRPDHPNIGMSLNNLAGIAWELHDQRKSLELSQRALKIWESQYGPDHPHVANSLTGVAGTHVSLGEPNKAIPLLERAVVIYDAHPRGPKSNEPTARFELAKVLVATGGDLTVARQQATKARVLYRELGKDGESALKQIDEILTRTKASGIR